MILALLLACTPDPDAPPEVAWDHATCDECAMLVSEPAHAAALRVESGETYVFDDPGCLFRYVARTAPRVTHMWFHDDLTWLRESEAGFLPGGQTPMGSGMVTVHVATPGALTVGAASNQVLSR